MPKTTNGLWAKLIDFDNLYQAFQEARHGKRYRLEVMRFASNLEENLINLQNHLIWKTWAPGKQREFTVFEPKMRMIQAPPFADRVIHHALVRLVDPLFERKFTPDSFACREGKGTQRAVFRAQHFLRIAKRNWGDKVYVLKADISKYFASIRHDVLMTEVERTISDKDVLWLWRKIISGYRIWPTHILPRKRNIKRARLAFREMAAQYHAGEIDLEFVRQRVMSFLAYSKHCSAKRTVEGVLGDLVLVRKRPGFDASDNPSCLK